jgi:L-lactate dehydrogenase complex protein LldG
MMPRELILSAIKANKPAEEKTAEIHPIQPNNTIDLVAAFKTNLETAGGHFIRVKDAEAIRIDFVRSIESGLRIVNQVREIGPVSSEITSKDDAVSLSDVEKTFLNSKLGVAENGAVWLTEEDMVNRLLPFITQHLVIVIQEKDLVANMHEAYAGISETDQGYHVFIAGPSKTADIEQSLVIGAHGPGSLLVYLVG